MLLRVLLLSALLVQGALAETSEVQEAIMALKSGNTKTAVKTLENSCKAGNQESCSLLGELYLLGWGVDRDLDRAYKLLSKSCTAGIAEGCNEIGLMYQEGIKFKRDFSKAAEYFRKACNLNSFGQGLGCYNYGNIYFFGRGVTPDFQKALQLFLKACNLGAALGCNNAGVIYEKGLTAKKDLKKAIDFYSKACHTENIEGKKVGCYNLGRLLYRRKDEGFKKEAVNYLTLSCNLGYQPACDE